MKYPKIISVLLALLLLCSCEDVLEFDPGDISPYPVMVAKPDTGDSLISVYISNSRFFLDDYNDPQTIAGATVVMHVNGTPLTGVYDNTSDRYLFAVHPQPGDTLHLTAQVPGFDQPMSAGTRVPKLPQVEITDFVIDTTDFYVNDWDSSWYRGNYYYRIKFKLHSSSPLEYYSVRVLSSEGGIYGDTTHTVWDTNEANFFYVAFKVNDPIVNTTNIEDLLEGETSSGFYGNTMFFSNEMFQNGEHEFTIEYEQWGGNYGGNTLDYSQIPILLKVQSLSRELYLYSVTKDAQDNVDLFFSEPVQVYSNIQGGVGIFGASSLNKQRLPAPRFEHFNHSRRYQ